MGLMFRSVMRWFFTLTGVVGVLLATFSAIPPWPLVGIGMAIVSIAGLLAFRK